MRITKTRSGLRLSQHGVVISELRTSPGPTHSVFDVLSALIAILPPTGPVGVMGFAGGGMLAPLRFLGFEADLDAVDLDVESYRLFCRACPRWSAGVRFHHAEAGSWLRRRRSGQFAILVDDLSVPVSGDVTKPDISWTVLPELMRRKLGRRGVAIFNLLPPLDGPWRREVDRVARLFPVARVVDLDEYVNRILIAGDSLPSARELGRRLRSALRRLGSRQAGRLQIRNAAH